MVLLDVGGGGIVPRGTRVEVFQRIFDVFLVLGTLVGVVVIAYMSWKAYKYRSGGGNVDDEVERPQLGELPTGSGGGRKLFVSFGMSAVIVISLVAWTYGTLLFVEEGPEVEETESGAEALEITVEGSQFKWEFVYPNGHRSDVLRVPVDREIQLAVTSMDVFHNFGIAALRVKTDAIPGQTSNTWFVADEPGEYTAGCYELCGAGHSYMTAPVVVMEPGEYREWYAGTSPNNESSSANSVAVDPAAGVAA